MALRVFLVNFTSTVLAFPGWRVRDSRLPLSERARTTCAGRLLFERTCLALVVTATLQAWPERSLSLRPFCLTSFCFLATVILRPHAAWRAPRTTWPSWF